MSPRGAAAPGRGAADPAFRRLVDEARVEAERTLALVRIGVAAALLLVVAVAVLPNAPPDPTLFRRQVVLAVGTPVAYLALGVASWRLAPLVPARPWIVWGSATLDVLFMAGSLALTALNAGLPAAYVAAFPSLWIAPVILALGALRYDPWLQAWSTGLAAALLLAGFALRPGAPTAAGPLDFFFAGPPNLVRTAMLALAGGVLVVAVARTRRLLARAIDEGRRRQAAARFLPPELADRLADGDPALLRGGLRREAAVLFVDLRGFTGMAEGMAPAAVTALVAAFRRRVLDAASAHRGLVDKFVGDAAMVLFGVPEQQPDDAARGLACARAIAAAVDAWNRERAASGEGGPLGIGMGLHAGPMFFGAVGDGDRLEFTVLGDAVNVASRLEGLTREVPFDLVASAGALRAAGEVPHPPAWAPLPGVALRGRRAPVDLYGSLPRANASSAGPDSR